MSRARYSGAHTVPDEITSERSKKPAEKIRKGKAPPVRAVQTKRRSRRGKLRMSRRMKFLLGAVVAALLLAVAAFAMRRPTIESIYRENMKKALVAYEQSDYDNSLRFLRRAAACEESEECLLLMASCYEQSGQLDRSLELLRRIDGSNSQAAEKILEIEEQRNRNKTASNVNVLGQQLAPNLTELNLDGRDLTDLNLEEIVQLYALDSLSLADNPLTDISPLTALDSLDELNLSNCRVADLSPLRELTSLRSLCLDGNPLEDLTPLYELQNLTFLSIQNCGVDEKELSALAAALPACAIISKVNEEDVSEISLGGLTFRSDAEELDLSGRGIRDISVLAECQALKRLNLSGNEISNLQGLMNLPEITRLDLSSNLISDLRPLMGLASLRSLNAAENLLTDTSPMNAMPELQTLDLSHNPIQDFSGLRRLTNLTTLRLNDTGLVDADLFYISSLTMLNKLSIDDNPEISNEAFGKLRSSLPDCSISHTDLVYSIPIGGKTVQSNIINLDLSGQGVEDLSGLERLGHLESLDLSRNQITDLYIFSLSASRNSLRELNLAYNRIERLNDLKSLSVLESLNLYGNPLSGIKILKELKGLKQLNVGNCGLSEEQLSELRDALPSCEIVLEY